MMHSGYEKRIIPYFIAIIEAIFLKFNLTIIDTDKKNTFLLQYYQERK